MPVTTPELDPKNGFPPVINWLQQWPFPTATPRPYYRSNMPIHGENDDCGWPNWLLDPPPTMVRRVTAVPVAMMSRLYSEDFWSTDVAKYSHQALRFPVHEWRGKPLRSSFYLSFTPRRDLLKAFRSKAAWPWLSRSVTMLSQVGEDALSEYIYHRAMRAAGAAVTRRRLHYERRRWRHSDAAIVARGQEINRLRAAALAGLEGWHVAAADRDPAALQAYLGHAALLVVEALELARLVGWEVSALQLLVSECARLDDAGRLAVKRYTDSTGTRVERRLKPIIEGAVVVFEELQRELAGVIPGLPPVAGADSLLRSTIVERASGAASVLAATRGMVYELGRSVDTIRNFSSAQHGNDSPVREAFNLLVDTASGRQQQEVLQRLAEHRIRELPSNSPIHRVLRVCFRILERG